MKQQILLAILVGLITSQINAQERFLGMSLHATYGIKQVNVKSSFGSAGAAASIATSLGAGSSWNIDRFIAGSEFYYSTASRSKDQILSRYTSLNSNLYSGYQLIKKGGWQVSYLTGLGMSRSQMLLTAKEGTNSTKALHSHGYLLHTSFRVERINSKGSYMGLKIGYNFSPGGKRDWKHEGSEAAIGSSDNPGGYFLQLNAGGMLKIKNYKS